MFGNISRSVSLRPMNVRYQVCRPRFLHLSPTRRMAKFFAPTSSPELCGETKRHPSEPSGKRKSHKVHRNFLDPNAFYPDVEITDASIMESVMRITYEPISSWNTFCSNNMHRPLDPGSFVEFIHDNQLQFGVVLQEPACKFNPYHNRMLVLTLHNELLRVYAQDVTFTCHQVLATDPLDLADILKYRTNESFPARTHLVQVIHQFMALAASFRGSVPSQLKTFYSNVASHDRSSPVSIAEVLRYVSQSCGVAMPSCFHQSAFFMSVYLEMCSDPARWMVPGCVVSQRVTNLVGYACSNLVPPPALFIANPLPIMDDVLEFLQFTESKMNDFDTVLNSLLQSPKHFDDLAVDFMFWGLKPYRSAIKCIMYALIYPHQQILSKLSQLGVLKKRYPTQRALKELLDKIGIFDNKSNVATDPLLSSGVLGAVKDSALVASSPADLEHHSLHRSIKADFMSKSLNDKFPHLRSKRSYFHDTVVYVIPGIGSNMAVSIEKLNSRRYLVNFHVPDLATKLSPSSISFDHWASSGGLLQNKPHRFGVDQSGLLPQNVLQELLFSDVPNMVVRKNHFTVGDFHENSASSRHEEVQDCMTITFEYNAYLEEPTKDLENSVSISFDSLKQSQFRVFDETLLEKSLTGKLEPSILGKLKLFHQKRPSSEANEEELSVEDHHNVNLIFNILRRHFQTRNRKSATSLHPKCKRQNIVKVKTVNTESNTIETSVLPESREECKDKLTMFRTEAENFIGALTAAYCNKNGIPVYYRTKPFLDVGIDGPADGDEVMIKHENALLPDFSASSYFQTAFGRDISGHISRQAFLFSSNFVGLENLSVFSNEAHVPLGLDLGYVNVVDAVESLEAFLNQLQILANVHFVESRTKPFFHKAAEYSYLKSLGYPLHGPLSQKGIDSHCGKLFTSWLGANYFQRLQRRYWILRDIARDPGRFRNLKCFITKVCRNIEEHTSGALSVSTASLGRKDELEEGLIAVRAYCEELDIEVSMVVDRNATMTVGSEVFASQIVNVDAISGEITLA